MKAHELAWRSTEPWEPPIVWAGDMEYVAGLALWEWRMAPGCQGAVDAICSNCATMDIALALVLDWLERTAGEGGPVMKIEKETP